MSDLMPLVRGYLESAGLNILRQEGDLLVADKLVFGQDRDTWIVWTVPPDQDATKYERSLRGDIPRVRANYPDAKAYVLSASRGGFSRDMLQVFTDSRIKFLVPIWFFDSPFRDEEAPGKATTAIRELHSKAKAQLRVPQPFRVEGEDVDLHNRFA